MNPFVIAFRRIIYSIPLKRLLLGLAVFGVLFASFSSASDFGIEIRRNKLDNWQSDLIEDFTSFDKICVFTHNSAGNQNLPGRFVVNGGQEKTACYWDYYLLDLDLTQSCCTDGGNVRMYSDSSSTDFYVVGFNLINESDCPVSSQLTCQTEYNLIPISSVDQNYCTTNNLCPSGGTPSDCPNVGVSNLYINDIFHPGAFNVIMNIPEEIDWDYAYTNSGQNFNIDVVGYNQDFEKIEDWIYTNNYKPTSDDFTNIFKNFSNFGGLLVGALFVILVFYFVKKIFK